MDVEQINDIMTNANKQEVSFSDAQWLYLQDINQGNYTTNINFVSTVLKQQFIDYFNSFVTVPIAVEIVNALPDSTSEFVYVNNHKVPIVAFRQSVYSMFGQLVCTTDQGQQMFNDQNTWWINNKRFELEQDMTWMRSEGELLDYAYDRWEKTVPMQSSTAGNIGPNNATGVAGIQSTPNFLAPQGIEPGAATGNPPLTNDANLFGNNQLGTSSVIFGSSNSLAGAYITSIGGVALGVSGTYYVPWNFPDGRTGYVQVTTGAASQILSIGGATLSPAPTVAAAGTYTVQAVGTTNVLSQPQIGELFTVPIVLTYTNTTAATFTSIGGQAFVASTTVHASAYGQISGFNPNCNQGFLDRVTIFQNTSTYVYQAGGSSVVTPAGKQPNLNGAHIFYYRAVVPVKFLHDMFMQMKSPIINLGLNLTLYLTQQNGPAGTNTIFPALQTSNNVGLITGGQDNTANPAIFYGQGFGGAEACRWYYRTVKFSPTDTARMAEMLTTGFTKSFKFISTDFNQASNTVGTGSQFYQYQFATSSVHPLRCHAYFAPIINNGTTTVNALSTFNYAPGVEPSLWLQTNVTVNNIPYYRQNFQNQQDQWEIVREQFNPDGGAMLMYTDFLGYKRCNLFDVTRLADRLPSPTEPVNLMSVSIQTHLIMQIHQITLLLYCCMLLLHPFHARTILSKFPFSILYSQLSLRAISSFLYANLLLCNEMSIYV